MNALTADCAQVAQAAERLIGQQGRVIVVSGASGSIGSVCALQLAELGAHVIAGYHTNADAAARVAGRAGHGRIVPVQADLTDPVQAQGLVHAALDRYGRVDACV
ncbi:MAG: SDR family NAD(P)-dependent oxidoreductase, partial [Dietzia sp.]|nr:SDR family NAD(P)-dependent oxidoreductase [Dietzia sp.]